jgi:hypothetical protein
MNKHLASLRYKLDEWTSNPASLHIVAEELFALRASVSKKRDDLIDGICKPTADVLVIVDVLVEVLLPFLPGTCDRA